MSSGYAQHGEDLALARLLPDVERGFYIDVGAGHPESCNVTKLFYDRGWSGINIEPAPTDYRLLCAARPRDINLNCCAGASEGVDCFAVYPAFNEAVNAQEAGIRAIFARQGLFPIQRTIQTVTLNTVIRIHAPEQCDIHFLKIDVEGYERRVLEGLDLSRYRPWVLCIEATEPYTQIRSDHKWNDLIFAAGYRQIAFDGLNCFYQSPDRKS